MTKKNRQCPEHGVRLVREQTVWGPKYVCPMDGCTVLCWGGKTSTPANQETRTARHHAHEAFDPLWKERGENRSELYHKLASFMGLEPRATHIGMFDVEQCQRVLRFVEEFE